MTTRSPLSGAGLARFTGKPGGGVVIKDCGVPALLMLRGDPQRVALSDLLTPVLGFALPDALQCAGTEASLARWMSPDSWLLSVTHDTLEATQQALLDALGGHGAVVDVSGAFAVLELSGPAVMEVLQKSTGYDVHPDNFPEGKVVSTTFAKAGVTLRNQGQGSYELIVRRSFAQYVFHWLVGASGEHGLRASTE